MWPPYIQGTVAAHKRWHCMWFSIIQLMEDLKCGAIEIVVLLHAMVSNELVSAPTHIHREEVKITLETLLMYHHVILWDA